MQTFAQKYPTYMTAETSRALIEIGRKMQEANAHRRAVLAARAAMRVERRVPGRERRVQAPTFHTMQDKLNFVERRQRDRRFDSRPMPLDLRLPE